MSPLRNLIGGLRALLRKSRAEQEMTEELHDYLDAAVKEKVRRGMSLEEARRAAKIEIGGIESVKEGIRAAGWEASVESLGQDLRYGLRQLRRNPGFTAVAVITLALGIGANTAIFSLIDAVMLRSLPVREPSQLVLFRWNAHHGPNGEYSSFDDCPGGSGGANPSGCSFPLPVFDEIRSQTKAFAGVTAFAGPAQLDLSGNGPPSMAAGELVSGSYFSMLGVNTVLGRAIGPDDDSPAASPVIVLSYAYWQSAFGAERSDLGRTIVLNNVPFTIVGVAERNFTNLAPGKTQDFWLPIAMLPRLGIDWGQKTETLENWWLVILGRLKPGVSIGQARAAASLIFKNEMLHGEKPVYKPQDNPSISLTPAQAGLTGSRGEFSDLLYVLMFAVGLILLIACANVAGLLLARATTRQKEMAVRLAVGAGRARIFRQLLTESVMLSLAGGALGILFVYWGIHAITVLLSGNPNHPFPFAVGPDWRVLVFTLSASLVTGILFGLAPAFRSTRLDLTPTLKENASTVPGGVGHARGWLHLGNTLVIAQVGLSVVVLIGAGLLVRTLENLRAINPGFDTRNLLLFGVDPTLAGYKNPQIQNLYRNLQARLAALPGVASVSYSSDALLTGSLWTSDVHIEGHPEKKDFEVDMLSTGPGFFRTLRIPLLEGRAFTSEDFEQAATASAVAKAAEQSAGSAMRPSSAASSAPAAPIPVVVNRTLARSYFANDNPLGKRLASGSGDHASGDLAMDRPKNPTFEIIGVAGDAKYSELRRAIHPTVYVPATGGGAYFELRTVTDPTALIRTVREAVRQVDSRLPLFEVRTQSEKIDDLLAGERLVARLSSFFGALAVLLACVGLYGLLSYELARRTRELGIRMALGAEGRDVLKLVLGQGLRLVLVGVAIGVVAALVLTRFLASLLYGVKASDPLTIIVAAMVLSSVALIACYIPARRATKVDPMVALRYE